MEDFYTISNTEVKGKLLVVRIDINSSLRNGKPIPNKRIEKHAQTLSRLSDKGAKIVVLGHQGRKGKFNYSSLKEHSLLLSKACGKNIEFVSWEEDWISKVSSLVDGEILLLDNVRYFDDEVSENAEYVSKLLSYVDYYVLDSFSIVHRKHASIVGFKEKPCFAGFVLEEEYKALKKMKGKETVYFLGGAKVSDTLFAIKELARSTQTKRILVSGVPSKVFLKSQGHSFGKEDLFLKKFENEIKEAKEILIEAKDKIILPLDFVFLKEGLRTDISINSLPINEDLFDIGDATIKEFSKHTEDAGAIVFNGAPGLYETKEFCKGTCALLNSIAQSPSVSFIGGGDTEVSLSACGVDSSLFSYVSISGKAMLDYLANYTLPGLEILKK